MSELNLIAPEYYNMVNDIERHAKDPNKIAILWENEEGETKQFTYFELSKASNRLANGLKKLGVEQGDKIIVILPRVIEAYITYMAALKIGAVILPGSEMLMPKDILYRATHSGAKAIVTYHTLTSHIDEIRKDCPNLETYIILGEEKQGWTLLENVMENQEETFEICNTTKDDIAFLNYTSGTTGNPKGVIHTHSWAFAHQAVAAKLWLDVRDGDVVWATAGPGWAKWNWSPFMSTLGSGGTGLVYYGRFEPKKYLRLLEKYNVNVLCCTPTEYRIIAKEEGLDQYNLSTLHSTVSAGEPLNREVIDTFKKYFNLTVRDGYGQTENTLLIGTLKGMEVKPGSMGRPTPGNRIAIINEDGQPVQKGEVGDIAVHRSVPALFKGYLNDPERTSASYRGEWYLTGDQAKEDEDGYYFFEGRSDDIIISSGYTIGPFEVEDALVKHPEVKECAVVASPDPVRGSIVKAFVVLVNHEHAGDSLLKELQEHVKNTTAPYKYPREIEFVEDLPKTTSGKIRRIELRQLEKQKKVLN